MSAEKLPTPRTDEEVRANFKWSNGFGSEVYIPVKFARQLERDLAKVTRRKEHYKQMLRQAEEELAQAKAELSALSRASGEAVAWVAPLSSLFPPHEPAKSYTLIWREGKQPLEMPFSPTFAPSAEMSEIPGTVMKLYAAPTAPGMCLDAERLDWLEGEMEREQVAMREGRNIPSSLFRSNMPITRTAIDRAIAAAKGRAAT